MIRHLRTIFGQKIINVFWHLPKNLLLNIKNSFPGKNIKIIGVTGTDGKTSTCVLLHEILKNSGYKVALISTIGAKIGDTWFETQPHMTVPDPQVIHSLLKRIKKEKVDYLILEVTSIALDQYRYLGCQFEIGIFLNLAHDHLDYHQTMENYLAAKASLLKRSRIAIANSDDKYFSQLKKIVSKRIVTFGKNQNPTIKATDIKIDQRELTFKVDGEKYKTDSNYEYQIYNILAAIATARQLGITNQIIQKSILPYPQTKGRREEIFNKYGIRCIIDYAHTPQALENTFSSLKKTGAGRLISVFGATGGRDKVKRPEMGKIAQQFCDITILTSDDTRHESVDSINEAIVSGMTTPNVLKLTTPPSKSQISSINKANTSEKLVIEIENRQDAITTALLLAQARDTVASLGIGHQNSILIGNIDYPWSESIAFKTAFNHKQKSKL